MTASTAKKTNTKKTNRINLSFLLYQHLPSPLSNSSEFRLASVLLPLVAELQRRLSAHAALPPFRYPLRSLDLHHFPQHPRQILGSRNDPHRLWELHRLI